MERNIPEKSKEPLSGSKTVVAQQGESLVGTEVQERQQHATLPTPSPVKSQKISAKMLRGYIASERAGLDGIGFNDAWNVDKFGITQAQAAVIRKAMAEEYGLIRPTKPDLAALNRRVEA